MTAAPGTHRTVSLHTVLFVLVVPSESFMSLILFLFVAGGTKTRGTRESVVHSNSENFTQTSEQPDAHGPAQTYQVNALKFSVEAEERYVRHTQLLGSPSVCF